MHALHSVLSHRHHCTILHRYSYARASVSLTTPCHYFMFQTQHVTENVWTITVHKSFMINVTIAKAFVPYSRNCKNNYLTVSHCINKMEVKDGARERTKHNHSEYYCGHTHNEAVYSEENKVVLTLKVSVENVAHITQLVAFYQVHIVGWAYRYSTPLYSPLWYYEYGHYQLLKHDYYFYNYPDHHKVPTQVLFIAKTLAHIWYLTNNVIRGQFIFHQIHINTLICTNKSSVVEVFSGLQSQYMRQWVVRPHRVFQCDITYLRPEHINVTFHMYATLAATLAVYDTTIRIDLRFSLFEQQLACATHGETKPATTPGVPVMTVTCFPPAQAYLTLTSLEYTGPQSTVAFGHVLPPGEDVQYNQGMVNILYWFNKL